MAAHQSRSVHALAVFALLVFACHGHEDDTYIGGNPEHDHCTTIAVGRRATTDGSVMSTHTNDCDLCDSRVTYVAPADYEPGSKRPVFMALRGEYPRFVGRTRGPMYHPVGDQVEDQPMGYIEQVSHTYGYYDAAYGVVNEMQVGIGESTCSAKIWAKPKVAGGHALFDVFELSRLAMERAKTAREAIRLMGDFAVKYGYYSQWDPPSECREEAGEALTVTDATEAWMFNILASPCGKSAVWAAKRVPDDEVAVTANFFTVNEVNVSDSHNYMASDNVMEVAKEMGWWDGKETFSFVKAYAPIEEDKRDKEYFINRMWRVFDLVAPSLKLTPWHDTVLELPFSVKPDRLLTAADVMKLNRDLYEGTDWDLTKGASAGPFGSPLRMDGMSPSARAANLTGMWARAVSLARTSYSTVIQTRSWLPNYIGGILWLGQDAPHSTVYVPFYTGATDTSPSFQTGSLHKFTRDSAWWAFDFVSNWAEYKWKYIMTDVRAKQAELENSTMLLLQEVDNVALSMHAQSPAKIREYLTNFTRHHAEHIVKTWWELADFLIAKYNDGYVNFPKVGGMAGYPKWWLEHVGYDMDPRYKHIQQTTLLIANHTDMKIVEDSRDLAASLPSRLGNSYIFVSTFIIASVIIGAMTVSIGFVMGRRSINYKQRYLELVADSPLTAGMVPVVMQEQHNQDGVLSH